MSRCENLPGKEGGTLDKWTLYIGCGIKNPALSEQREVLFIVFQTL